MDNLNHIALAEERFDFMLKELKKSHAERNRQFVRDRLVSYAQNRRVVCPVCGRNYKPANLSFHQSAVHGTPAA